MCYRVGAVACWEIDDQWHWGRFVVDDKFRGLGIGKQLAYHSLQDIFNNITESLTSDARDTTVQILKGLGGQVTGQAYDFYGMPVTPINLTRSRFQHVIEENALISPFVL
ncbi:GNAT family N-acetyltransferase [Shewanella psychrophila]|uniref:GNAT family N-acetyltransferase n=1 Tax=Shewanella psychrophila TaxID=225848 RepID=UPI00098BBE8E